MCTKPQIGTPLSHIVTYESLISARGWIFSLSCCFDLVQPMQNRQCANINSCAFGLVSNSHIFVSSLSLILSFAPFRVSFPCVSQSPHFPWSSSVSFCSVIWSCISNELPDITSFCFCLSQLFLSLSSLMNICDLRKKKCYSDFHLYAWGSKCGEEPNGNYIRLFCVLGEIYTPSKTVF